MSDLERTILDELDRTDLSGGIKEITQGIWIKRNEIDWDKLAKYAEKFCSKAAIKRLGFILALLGIVLPIQKYLLNIVENLKDLISLDKILPKFGKILLRWRVQININIDELKASIW